MATSTVSTKTSPTGNLTALITMVRWATTTVGLIWAAALGPHSWTGVGLGVLLLVYAVVRTLVPIRYARISRHNVIGTAIEAAMYVFVVTCTGAWDSPYLFAVFTPIIATGFAAGVVPSVAIGTSSVAIVETVQILTNDYPGTRQLVAWGGEFLLVACVASYGRHLLSRAQTQDRRLLTLTQAHQLLMSLNSVSGELPETFNFRDTVKSAADNIENALASDTLALLLLHAPTSTYSVVHVRGARVPTEYATSQLPMGAATCVETSQSFAVEALGNSSGFASTSRAGLYVPLLAGDTNVGIAALEYLDTRQFTREEVTTLEGVAEQMALTIDNARWFERLRARGAAEERDRIARDLHDRVGQGVAYLAFELERLCSEPDADITEDLGRLRADSKKIVRELRETLYDLRTEVTDQHDLVETTTAFLERVEARSRVRSEFFHDIKEPIPLSLQRDLWRITQEAIINAERHAEATNITVRSSASNGELCLSVEDDGIGIPDSALTAHGPENASYGITGMRERAARMNARLTTERRKPHGTLVRVEARLAANTPDTADMNE